MSYSGEIFSFDSFTNEPVSKTHKHQFEARKLIVEFASVDKGSVDQSIRHIINSYFLPRKIKYKGPICAVRGKRYFSLKSADGNEVKRYKNVLVHYRTLEFVPGSIPDIRELMKINFPLLVNITVYEEK